MIQTWRTKYFGAGCSRGFLFWIAGLEVSEEEAATIIVGKETFEVDT